MNRVSVVTVVFDDLDGLRLTKASVEAQSDVIVEWIVCDGGSGLQTQEFLRQLPDSVKWVSETDCGVYDAMNKGVRMATYEMVVFMNAGDTFFDEHSASVAAAKLVSSDMDCGVLYGGAILDFPRSGAKVYRGPKDVESYIWHGLPGNHQATYYMRDVLLQHPFDLSYVLCGDYFLAAKLFRSGVKAAYLDMPVAVFSVGGRSYSRLLKLFCEPYRVQREVLELGFVSRFLSIMKKVVSTAGVRILSAGLVGKGVSFGKK